jgi:hypothetical protein
MSMPAWFDTLLVMAVVGVAALYLLNRLFRRGRGNAPACGLGCGSSRPWGCVRIIENSLSSRLSNQRLQLVSRRSS